MISREFAPLTQSECKPMSFRTSSGVGEVCDEARLQFWNLGRTEVGYQAQTLIGDVPINLEQRVE
jgi:hypothetical protein